MIFDGTLKNNSNQWLYYRSMGKIFRVVGIAEDDEEANAFSARKSDWPHQYGVIGVTAEGYPVIAQLLGEKIKT